MKDGTIKETETSGRTQPARSVPKGGAVAEPAGQTAWGWNRGSAVGLGEAAALQGAEQKTWYGRCRARAPLPARSLALEAASGGVRPCFPPSEAGVQPRPAGEAPWPGSPLFPKPWEPR